MKLSSCHGLISASRYGLRRLGSTAVQCTEASGVAATSAFGGQGCDRAIGRLLTLLLQPAAPRVPPCVPFSVPLTHNANQGGTSGGNLRKPSLHHTDQVILSSLLTLHTNLSLRTRNGHLVAGRRGAERVLLGQVPWDRGSGCAGNVLHASLPGQDTLPEADKEARYCERDHGSPGAAMNLGLTGVQPTLPHSFLFGHLIVVGKALSSFPSDL